MQCRHIRITRHALARLEERDIAVNVVEHVVRHGDIIREYPDDTPYPSVLLLGTHADDTIHVVAGVDNEASICHVITAYRPDTITWNAGFRSRR